jgi:hypothetical protein
MTIYKERTAVENLGEIFEHKGWPELVFGLTPRGGWIN